MTDRLLRFGDKPLIIEQRSYTQGQEYKPHGLWLSVNDSWKEWCEAESYALDRLVCVSEVVLHPEAKILRLTTPEAIDQFTEQYPGPPTYMERHRLIDWPTIAARWQGILISPYQFSRRLSVMWYYTWDCASACVWDLTCIADVKPVIAIATPGTQRALSIRGV